MFDIKAQVKKLPKEPGVYLMKDQYGHVIYIGKAKNLKNRVSSYFRGTHTDKKTLELVSRIVEFEYIITDSEVEALILEASMIRKYQPQYNILLRDDKQYPYIKITVDEKYPRVMKVFRVKKDKARYYGPYVSGDYLHLIMAYIREYYPLRTCGKVPGAGLDRPCLNYDIKRCLAPCFKDVDVKAYGQMIQEIMDLLEGRVSYTVSILKEKMLDHAEKLEFEKAAHLRNTISAFEKIEKSQKIYTLDESNRDVIGFHRVDNRVCFMVFFVRNGKLLGREHYIIEEVEGLSDQEVLRAFVERFYASAIIIPKEILIPLDLEDQEVIEDWLRGNVNHRVSFVVPKIGDKNKLLKMVIKNAEAYLDQFKEKIDQEYEKVNHLKTYFKETFHIQLDRLRVEAYDISNIFGSFSVGSMVVFEGGEKKKSDFRKFNIRTIDGQDDYGAMQEVIYRRFKRGLEERESQKSVKNKFDIFPDLLLIDGGIGHVSVVQEVMDALGLDIPVLGMVKDRRHKTKDLVYKGQAYHIADDPQVYRFIYKVQEEVHRFAIEHHKTLRLNAMTQSVLDGIPGVGKKRRTALMTHFKSLAKIKDADQEELEKVEGIPASLAETIYYHFRKGKSPDGEEDS